MDDCSQVFTKGSKNSETRLITHRLIFLCKYKIHKIIVHGVEYRLLISQILGIFMTRSLFTSSISAYEFSSYHLVLHSYI